jgi:hypothetical protein
MRTRIASPSDIIEPPSKPFFRRLRPGRVRDLFSRRAGSGLAAHQRSARHRKHAIPRWLILTVAAGMFVALVFVTFFAH